MSWEVINTNPQCKTFRLDELNIEQNEDTYLTEDELELEKTIKEQIIKNGYIRILGVV